MDSLPLRRKSTSVLSRTSSQSLTKSSSVNKATMLKRKSTEPGGAKPVKLRKNPSRDRKKPKPYEFEEKVVTKRKVENNNKKQCLFPRLSFLSIRNEEGSYFLCRALQNIYRDCTQFRVQWLTFNSKTKDYHTDYLADLSPESILTVVRMRPTGNGSYTLNETDRLETERLLKKSVDQSKGIAVSDEESETEEDEPPPKKKKLVKTKKGPQIKSPKERKPRAKKDPKDKAPRKKRIPKAELDLELTPNPKIKILDRDPFFESKDKVPFVSKYVQGKLAIRAILQNDVKMLKKVMQDSNKVYDLSSQRCVSMPMTAEEYAVKQQNLEAWKFIVKYKKDRRYVATGERDRVMIDRLGTGSYNPRSLNVRNIRQIMASRGTREGNNALVKDARNMTASQYSKGTDLLASILKAGVDWDFFKAWACENYYGANIDLQGMDNGSRKQVYRKISVALWNGHRELAGNLARFAVGNTFSGFSNLHADVLLGNGEELKNKVSQNAVTSQANETSGCNPIHCAAINPHTIYLETLLKASPDINSMDLTHKSPIHYAAVCTGTGPLELLIKMGGSVYDVDKQGTSPLHMACETGRARNVEILLGPKADTNSVQGKMVCEKFGRGGIHRMNRPGYQPIHLAAENGHLDVVKVLLSHGADINAQLSISKFRLSPLMLAVAHGHYDLVKFLVKEGAVVKQRDRLGRTALLHAVMNGHTHIASYLLNIGANPNTADSSGNTAVHYASAYGWPHATSLLLEAGADPNTQSLWKLSPLSIAWLKGHKGIVNILLDDDRVDVNFKDDKGQTLVHIASSSPLVEDLYDQMVYLITEKGGDPSIISAAGESADDTPDKVLDARRMKIAELLVKHGCPTDTMTEEGQTTLNLAVVAGCEPLCNFLITKGGTLSTSVNKETGSNLLHQMAENLTSKDMTAILKLLLKQNKGSADMTKMLKEMVNVENYEGYTPLLLACKTYAEERNIPGQTAAQMKSTLKNWREFISLLIEQLSSDVNATVGMMFYPDDPKNEQGNDKYHRQGKFSVVDFLMIANTELPDPDGFSGRYPALRMVLKHPVNVNTRNITGNTPLINALGKQDERLIQHLLQKGANVNTPQQNTKEEIINYPLPFAVSKGLVSITKLLLKNGADVNVQSPSVGQSALHIAATYYQEEKRIDLMEALIGGKCDVNAQNSDGCTPLHVAVNNNKGTIDSSNVVEELLIAKGCNLLAKDKEGRIPLHYVFHKTGPQRSNRPGAAQYDPIEQCRLLASAMKFKNLDTQSNDGQTILHKAAFRGSFLCCTYLLQKAPYLRISQGDKTGTTPLGYAVLNGHDNCACMLIQNDPSAVTKDIVIVKNDTTVKETNDDSDSSDDSDESDEDSDQSDSDSDSDRKKRKRQAKKEEAPVKEKPLWTWKPYREIKRDEGPQHINIFQRAIQKELQGVCFVTLELPSDVSELHYAKAIGIAIGEGKFNVALRLIGRVPDKNMLLQNNDHSQNILHLMALQSGTFNTGDIVTQTTDALLNRGVSLSAVDDYKRQPIFYAAYNHNFLLVNLFIGKMKKFDSLQEDKFGLTLLAGCLWNHHKAVGRLHQLQEFVDKLLVHKQRTAVLDKLFGFPVPDSMFGSRDQPTLEGDIYAPNLQYKCSPLVQAIRFQSFDFAKFLLARSADVNFSDSDSLTPLMTAVRQNNVRLVKLMLNKDYDPEEERKRIEADRQKKAKAKAAKKTQNVFTLKRVPTKQKDDDPEDSASEPESEEEEEEEDEDDQKANPREYYRAVTKKSKVNLDARDKAGRTALHHCVKPLALGTYDNPEIVWVLAKAGANLSAKDNQGKTPLDLALEAGAENIACMLQEMLRVNKKKWSTPAVTETREDVDDGILWKVPAPDVEADSKAFLDKLAANNPRSKEDKPQETVDDRCEVKTSGELVVDSELKRPYSALMTVVDVNRGTWGLYNFYKLQLIHQKGKDLYILFTCWGRIGETGQFQHTPFTTREEGVKEFCKIYRAKSGNLWQNRNGKFEPRPYKYRLVTFEEEHPGKRQEKITLDLKSTVPSKLTPYIQDMMSEFMDVSNLEVAINKVVDEDLLPLGRLKREDLLKAKEILLQLGDLAIEASKMSENPDKKDKEKLWEKYDKIGRLSSEYYQLIPQKCFVFEQIKPLFNLRDIEEQMKTVSDLLDFEMSTKIIMGSSYRKKEVNPMDYVYRALGCQIKQLREDDHMTQYLLRYVTATNRTAKVEAIYSLSRSEEAGCKLGNNKLLFHGSGVANFLGILKQGLLVAPPGVRQAGALFGKGVYTSDSFSKSQNYCYNYKRDSKTRFMLICKVALGNQQMNDRYNYDLDTNKVKKGYDSLFVSSGSRDKPLYDVKLPSGITVPLSTPGYTHNEYIVFNPNQVGLRYLVQFRK